MPNYAQSKIYVVRNTVNDKLYVGSTTRALSARMAAHRKASKFQPQFKLYIAFAELGVDNFFIELVEDFPCERHEQLLAREGAKIRELDAYNNGYNSRIEGRTKQQYQQDNADAISVKNRENYLANHEARLLKVKEYRAANIEAVRARKLAYSRVNAEANRARVRAYNETHKAEIAAKGKIRREENKDIIKAKKKAIYAAKKAGEAAAALAAIGDLVNTRGSDVIDRRRKYYAANKDKINAARKANYEAKKAGEAAAFLAAVVN